MWKITQKSFYINNWRWDIFSGRIFCYPHCLWEKISFINSYFVMLLQINWSFFETNSQPQFHSSCLSTLPRYSPCPGASSMLSGVKVIPLPDCARHVSAASMSTGRSRGGVGNTTELAWWLTQYSTHGTFQSSENQTASWQATGLILPTTKHYIVEDSN